MDSRLQNLSFSSLQQLHSCPRKWQLNRMQSREEGIEADDDKFKSNVTFAYGHTVGAAVQLTLTLDHVIEITKMETTSAGISIVDQMLEELPGAAAKPRAEKVKVTLPKYENLSREDLTIWGMFLTWETQLTARNDRQGKSFWSAVMAAQKLQHIQHMILKDYELVYYNGKPATELGFRITFPDGFKLRGFVDAVLRHRITGEILVLECKTTYAKEVPAAKFKNSAQAIGYSVVLDVLFPELSSYKVLYLVYKTKDYEWLPLPFTKTYLQRALWIQELLLDIEFIKLCEDVGVYPMRGENCYDFGRECEYINLCTLETSRITMQEPEEAKIETYDIELTIADLVQAQLEKA